MLIKFNFLLTTFKLLLLIYFSLFYYAKNFLEKNVMHYFLSLLDLRNPLKNQFRIPKIRQIQKGRKENIGNPWETHRESKNTIRINSCSIRMNLEDPEKLSWNSKFHFEIRNLRTSGNIRKTEKLQG